MTPAQIRRVPCTLAIRHDGELAGLLVVEGELFGVWQVRWAGAREPQAVGGADFARMVRDAVPAIWEVAHG